MNSSWHTLHAADILAKLGTTSQGLGDPEATARLERNGPNKLIEGKRKSVLQIFLSQFADLMIWILIAAAILSAFLGEAVDTIIILVVVALNAVLGTVQESKAEAALEALRNMAAPQANVIRNGAARRVRAVDLVPGDIVTLEAGDSVPADLRLLESSSLKIEESALTGESVPVEKRTGALEREDAALGDRVNLAYMGTSVVYGRGLGVVVETGMGTQMGAIAGQLATTRKETTPLQKQLNGLSNRLSFFVLAIALVVFVVGLIGGRQMIDMFLTAVSLAVAAIPEGLVAVVTIVLAMGMTRLAKRGAIIRRLPAVETLGSVGVICSDKTGTLTQNRMTVQRTWTEAPERLYDAMAQCNDARLTQEGITLGDPTETALIDHLVKNKLRTQADIRGRVRAGEIPFDSQRKRSTVAVKLPGAGGGDDGLRVFVKGAPDQLLPLCAAEDGAQGIHAMTDERRGQIESANEEMAGQALRVLAFAYKDVPQADFTDIGAVESDLAFCGLVGMIDPARPEARDAIATCREAGILPVMITGDHRATAVAIAQSLGMLSDGRDAVTGADVERMSEGELDARVERIGVYARVAPEHKSRIVASWQRRGQIVAMTGDGVNDAPALQAADIGVGMGITGTDVSKGASDMILTDDNFATIVTAVGEGRRIYDNIHKTVKFLLSSNMGEVLAVLMATVFGWSLFAPVHLLWINLVTDSIPALALGMEPIERDALQRPPRSAKAPLLAGRDWVGVLFTGAVEALATLLAYLAGGRGVMGTTMAFLTMTAAQLVAVLGFQSERTSILRIHPREHAVLWLGVLGSFALQLVVVLVPALRGLFGLAMPGGRQWLIVIGLAVACLAMIEAQKWIRMHVGEARGRAATVR